MEDRDHHGCDCEEPHDDEEDGRKSNESHKQERKLEKVKPYGKHIVLVDVLRHSEII